MQHCYLTAMAHAGDYILSEPLDKLFITLTYQLVEPVEVNHVVTDTTRPDSCQAGCKAGIHIHALDFIFRIVFTVQLLYFTGNIFSELS